MWFIENLFCTIVGLSECGQVAAKEILELACMVAKVASGKSKNYTSEVQLMIWMWSLVHARVTIVVALTDSRQSQTLVFVCHDMNQHNVLLTQACTTENRVFVALNDVMIERLFLQNDGL